MKISRRADFRAEIILVANSLDAGGIERVVSTLANEWTRRGRKVSVITLHDRPRFYQLDKSIHHVVIDSHWAQPAGRSLALARSAGWRKTMDYVTGSAQRHGSAFPNTICRGPSLRGSQRLA